MSLPIYYCNNKNCSKKDTCYRYQELLKDKDLPNTNLADPCKEEKLFILNDRAAE
ncbi:MAG: hypothetical protein Q4E61_04330 [Alphaproteobacteria bacterium]|nr:hypothetical protein [Alphaproteobacteria bacterium]